MIDKIQPKLSVGYTREAKPVSETAAPQPEKTQITGTGNVSAEVSLSEKAQFLQKAMQAAKEAPDVRADVVQAVQKQIQAGTYKIDHQKLADKLVSFLG